MMAQILQNIILFFREPKNLFAKLKEKPDLKGGFAILLFVIFLYQIWGIITGDIKFAPAIPAIFAWFFAFIIFTCTILLGIIYGSFYILLFCRIFGKRVHYKSILSAVIYCIIPIIIGLIIRMIYPINLGLDSLLNINDVHPILNIFYHRVEIFELWSSIMEVIAISVLSGLSYKKSTLIVFSSWVVSIVLSYWLGLKFESGLIV